VSRTEYQARRDGRRARYARLERGVRYCACIPKCAIRRCLAQLIVVTSGWRRERHRICAGLRTSALDPDPP
jgi:hypothetical protein